MWLIYNTKSDSAHHIEDNEFLLTKKCARPHGHTYQIRIKLDMEFLQKHYDREFVDFALISKDIDKIIDEYDHHNITDKFGIHTVENLQSHLKTQIINSYGIPEHKIILTIMETAKFGVEE